MNYFLRVGIGLLVLFAVHAPTSAESTNPPDRVTKRGDELKQLRERIARAEAASYPWINLSTVDSIHIPRCRIVSISSTHGNVTFVRKPKGDLVITSPHPEQWIFNQMGQPDGITVNYTRTYFPHNGITLFRQDLLRGGAVSSGQLVDFRTMADFDKVAHAKGHLQFDGTTVQENGKPILKMTPPISIGHTSAPVTASLRIEVPDSFSGTIEITALEKSNVDLGDLRNCDIHCRANDSSVWARDLNNLKTINSSGLNSTFRFKHLTAKNVSMQSGTPPSPSKFIIESGSGMHGSFIGEPQDFEIKGDFSAVAHSWGEFKAFNPHHLPILNSVKSPHTAMQESKPHRI